MAFLDSILKNNEDATDLKNDFAITDFDFLMRTDSDGDYDMVVVMESNVKGWAKGRTFFLFVHEIVGEITQPDSFLWNPMDKIILFAEDEKSSIMYGYHRKRFKNVSHFTGRVVLGSPDGTIVRKRFLVDQTALTNEWQKIEPIAE